MIPRKGGDIRFIFFLNFGRFSKIPNIPQFKNLFIDRDDKIMIIKFNLIYL
jgi:hypothetical protein